MCKNTDAIFTKWGRRLFWTLFSVYLNAGPYFSARNTTNGIAATTVTAPRSGRFFMCSERCQLGRLGRAQRTPTTIFSQPLEEPYRSTRLRVLICSVASSGVVIVRVAHATPAYFTNLCLYLRTPITTRRISVVATIAMNCRNDGISPGFVQANLRYSA